MLLWSYTAVIFTDPKSPSKEWHIAKQDTDQLLPKETVELKKDGTQRYCNKCNIFKPDRTHHCNICDKCILQFDHHCPWLNQCVGWGNHKQFVLFLLYGYLFMRVTHIFSKAA